MKLTTEQKQFLSRSLRENLSYRETYVEFYDHILSALEAKPQTMNFQDAVKSVIDEDFGGYEGMILIESRYKRTVTKEMQKKYLNFVIEYLKFPLIGIIGSLTFVFYFIARQSWFNYMAFVEIAFAIRIIPTLLKWTRHLKMGYIFEDTKTSVKDSFFVWLDYVPALIVITLLLLSPSVFKESPAVWFSSAGSLIIAFILALFALHTLSFYRVYKDEFKASITQ